MHDTVFETAIQDIADTLIRKHPFVEGTAEVRKEAQRSTEVLFNRGAHVVNLVSRRHNKCSFGCLSELFGVSLATYPPAFSRRQVFDSWVRDRCDERANVRSEVLLKFLERVRRVLYRIVQQSGDEYILIISIACGEPGNRDEVRDVRIRHRPAAYLVAMEHAGCTDCLLHAIGVVHTNCRMVLKSSVSTPMSSRL